jgi:hypothetical protein
LLIAVTFKHSKYMFQTFMSESIARTVLLARRLVDISGTFSFPHRVFFQFKFRLWLSGLLNRAIDSDIKVWNMYFECLKVTAISKKQNLLESSMRHENFDFQTSWNSCFSALEPEPLSLFWLMFLSMLHQAGQLGINNYVQINTYWRYIVRIMASNILLLASKKSFLTSQGLVGAGMNCRAL